MCSFLILPLVCYNNLTEKQKKIIFHKLNLRGPDKTNIFEFNGYVFIHCLLHFCGEVIKQPYFDEKNELVLCYNGEIYNYNSFGDYKSDTEMIIDQYRKHGIDKVKDFDGEFTFVIFDFKNRKIIQSSDIFATKPQWFCRSNDGIFISSFRSVICDCLNLDDGVNRNMIISTMKECCFKQKNIKKVIANKILIRDIDNLKILDQLDVYKFDLNQHKNSYDDLNNAFEEAIIKRVKTNNYNNEKVGLCLSGGYDSGAISCCLNKYNLDYIAYSMKCCENMDVVNKRLKMIKNKYFYNIDQETYLENKKKYQNEIEITSIRKYAKPGKILSYYNLVGDWAGVGMYYIFSESKKDNIKIFLSGQGADEIYSDYGWQGKDIKNMNMKTYKIDNKPSSFFGNFPDDLNEIFPWPNFYSGMNECFISKEEYTASLFGLETRYPFLDKKVVQEFLWLSKDLKNKNYKAPLYDYLTTNNYPFDLNKKAGFKTKVTSNYDKYAERKIYYLFSSISFLQLYLPLVIEFSKINYKNIFIIRKNIKRYASPKEGKNYKLLTYYKKKFNFEVINYENFENLKGIIFMVDGDIFGPHELNRRESLLFKLNKKNTLKISLTEHMNFKWVYNKFINDVDYCIFSNKYFTDQFNMSTEKNIYLGNTKYDNILTKKEIYKKFNLIKENKYCLILYPKRKYKNFNLSHLDKVYEYLKRLNFKIIVKTRPKDNNISKNHKGILNVCSDIYPNESLELMKISDLCIIFSSSANEETLFAETPCINFNIDNLSRNDYLSKNNIFITLNNINNITFDQFNKVINTLEKKNSSKFNELKNKYLFTHKKSSKKILEFLIEKGYVMY